MAAAEVCSNKAPPSAIYGSKKPAVACKYCPSDWDSYCTDDFETYAGKIKKDLERQTFLHPVIQTFLKTEAPGKKVLDIGCGPGNWCLEAVKCGATTVDGFDIQKGMVEIAQRATAQYSSVNIRVGDVMDMPYDDNTFDVAISILITCNLPTEALKRHFEELNRVLIPGGKALVHNLSSAAFQTMYLFNDDDEASLKALFEQILQSHKVSSLAEIADVLEKSGRVVRVCFTKDKNDYMFPVTSTRQLANGQVMWFKTERMTFPNYYYTDEYLANQIVAAGLSIHEIINPYTEERRMIYNHSNPEKQLSKTIIQHPPSLLYYVCAY